jgi:hypothetical protein
VRTAPPSPDPADRALGRRLASLLDRQHDLSAHRIQALLPDLLGSDPRMLNPLRDLVGRPAFLQLLRRRDGAGRSQLRHALLEELADTYSERVMVRLGAVLDGCLPEMPSASAPATERAPAPRATAPAELRRSHSRQQQARDHLPGAAPRERAGLAPLLALTGAISLVSGTAFAVLRSDLLCPSLGLCLSGEQRGDIDAALLQGEEAAEALERTASLEELNTAVERLNSALLRLVSQRLNGGQEERRQRLQALSNGARQRLQQEGRAEDRLREASRLIERLERDGVDDDRRFELIQEARTSLAAVPGDSFAAPAALGLQRRLELIRSRPGEPAPAAGTAATPADAPLPADGLGAPAPPPPSLPPPAAAPPAGQATPAPPPPIDSTPPPPTEPLQP